jgi:hypothetical protein
MRTVLGLDDADDVFLAHHQQFLAVDLDLGAGVLAEQHLVADLDRQRPYACRLSRILPLPTAIIFALHRLLGGGVRDDDAASRSCALLRGA